MVQEWRSPSWMGRRGIYRRGRGGRRGDWNNGRRGSAGTGPGDAEINGPQRGEEDEQRVRRAAWDTARRWRRIVVLSFPSRLRGRGFLWCGCLRTISDWLAGLGEGNLDTKPLNTGTGRCFPTLAVVQRRQTSEMQVPSAKAVRKVRCKRAKK
jgi:hypothetical protein